MKSIYYFNNLIVNKVLKKFVLYNLEKAVIISSFNPFVLKLIKNIMPSLPTAFLWSTKDAPFLFNSPLWVYMCKPDGFHIDINNVDEKIIKWAKRNRLTTFVYTVNNLSDIDLVKDLEIDGVFTDDPNIKINSL